MDRYRAQEPDLIRAWQEDGCDKSLTLLIGRYKPMIGAQIQKILAGRSIGATHRPDLEQEANLAFIHAVSSFDPKFGTHLSSFAINHVRKTLLRYALDFRHSYRIGTSSAERKAFYAALARRADRIHKVAARFSATRISPRSRPAPAPRRNPPAGPWPQSMPVRPASRMNRNCRA